MIDLSLDLSEFKARARAMDGAISEVPFALAGALNTAAFAARSGLIQTTWPGHVQVRNRSFIRAALRVETATKGNLTVAVVDVLGRAHLGLHAKGGVKQARGKLAIPTSRVRRTGKGVAQSDKPLNLKRKVVKGGLIFQAEGRGKNSRLRLMYRLAPKAVIKPDVPFREDFARMMRTDVMRSFGPALIKAMRTAR